jgi:hypothetical protein
MEGHGKNIEFAKAIRARLLTLCVDASARALRLDDKHIVWKKSIALFRAHWSVIPTPLHLDLHLHLANIIF